MTPLLPTLTEEEIAQCSPTREEQGFGSLVATEKGGALPLRAMDVRARIDGLLSHLSLSQTFVNTHGEPIEATYIFPLPDRAAVGRFRMQVCGRVIEGELKERGQARQDYDTAIQAGQRAAIAEEERPNVFTLRVGNLMPGQEATVRLDLVWPLLYSDGEATFRFPLVVAPRYIPGTPLSGIDVGGGTQSDTDAVPDASRISPPVLLPGYPNPVRLSLTIDVFPSAIPFGEFRCSLHSVLAAPDDKGIRRIVLQAGERLNRDFILRFRVGENAVKSSLLLLPDGASSQEGTFALTLVPPVGLAQGQNPRDVVFVLDRSGSMGGWKMVAARRALAQMVETLTERDRFTVYAFDDRIETAIEFHNAGLVSATDRHRFVAAEFLGGIEARGGTEMAQPLDLAVHTLSSTEARESILVLVTDGQVGNEDQILHNLGERVKHIRIFALGIDQAVNEGFLRRLAGLGRGACECVESEERLQQVMQQVHRHIGSPVLTDLHLEGAGFSLVSETVVPKRATDLFSGAPLCLMGRYRGQAEGSVVLQALDGLGRRWASSVAAEVRSNPAIGSVWARAYIRELEDRYAVKGGNAQLEKQIVETSLRFGVLCRFTAFVAVDRTEEVNKSGQVHPVTQAVEAPAGWEMLADEKTMGGLSGDAKQIFELNKALQQAIAAGDSEQAKQAAQLIEKKAEVMGARAAKKTMLAKQTLQELNAGGRVSKRTQLAVDDMFREVEEGFAAGEGRPITIKQVQSLGSLALMSRQMQPPADGAPSPALDAMRREIEKQAPPAPDMVTMGKLPQTPRAKQAIEFAHEEARSLQHSDVDAGHLLLGLLRVKEGFAAKFLENLNLEELREEVLYLIEEAISRSRSRTVGSSSGHFTDRALKALQFANQEAQRLNHEYIGTEHILLGLVKEGSVVPSDIQSNLEKLAASDSLIRYRHRAFRLLCALRRSKDAPMTEKLRALGVLADHLGGWDQAARAPFQQILETLRTLLARSSLTEAEVQQVWEQAESVLQAFSGAA